MPNHPQTSQLQENPQSEIESAEWKQCQLLADQCGIPCISLRTLTIDPELLKKLTPEVMQSHKMVPLSKEDQVITLAMADPLDVLAEDIARYATGCRIQRVIAPLSHIQEVLSGQRAQSETLLDAILRRIPESGEITYLQSADAAAEQQQKETAELEPTAPIIQLVSSIIGDAIRMGASDIHVEPLKHCMRVRYRLDGYLRTIVELPQRVQSPCITRFKIISGLDISESRKPQDGRTRAVLEGREVDMRVSSLPTYFGEKVVLRILDPKAVMVDMDNLGFSPDNLASVKQVLASSQGMLLCTGPTGSGKTSTLYSALIQLNQESDNVVTVEDPIEYQLDGINQVQVNVRAGVSFASALRSILRQDPDVVLIGEIRDLETAEIAVQSAQTGHLVLSTLHTNDALSTVSRLVLMGIAPYLLASSLLCVIAQRLVRRLCPHCRTPGEPSAGALALLRAAGITEPPTRSFLPGGCEQCNYVGYRGRMGIFELMVVTDRIRQLLLEQASEAEIERVARSEGMRSLLEDGMQKCLDGLTSLDEILRVITIRRVGGRRCPGCDASIPPEHAICAYCGLAVLLLCSQCQAPLQPEWHFCPQCHHSIGEAQSSDGSPVVPPPPPALPAGPVPPLEEADPLNQQKWVLLVTSDEVLRSQIAGCLVDEEYCVLTADDGDHATTLTRCHMPDLVILDIETPNLNSVDWVGALRGRLETSLISVLLLTTSGPDGSRGLDCGADSYLVMPFAESQLLDRVRDTLEQNPRMSGPPKVALPAPLAGVYFPTLFSDPLRRMLAASHSGHDEVAIAELAGVARLVIQYAYSVTACALRLFGRIPGLPLWSQPHSLEALNEKVAMLPELISELQSLQAEKPALSPLYSMVWETARQARSLQELWESQPAPAERRGRLARGIGLLRPWLQKARAFCSQAQHRISGPDEAGVFSGVVEFGEVALTLDNPTLHLYTRFADS